MKQIEATIYVEPTAKGRPRVTVVGGHAHAYTPTGTRKAEQLIQALIRTELKPNFTGYDRDTPLAVYLTFYRERPKHLPKKVTMPITRPDLDQYIKLILDSLNKYVWADDSQIVNLHARKLFGSPPRIELLIREDIRG